MVFALLTKVIAVLMRLTIIHLRYLSRERFLALRLRLSRSLVWLQVGLHKFFEQFIGRGQSASRSESQSGNQSKKGPGVGLWDRAGEVLPKWGPPIGPGSLTSSSSTWSIGKGFWQGEQWEEQWRQEPLRVVSKIDLIEMGRDGLFFFQTGWLSHWV